MEKYNSKNNFGGSTMRTTDSYNANRKKYRILTRGTQRALKEWKKSHPTVKVVDVTRQIYKHYATLGITYVAGNTKYWVNVLV